MGLESGRQKELEKLYKQLEGLGRHSWEPDLKVVLPLVVTCGILGSFLGVLGYRWMQLQHSQHGYTTYHERLQNDNAITTLR